jgi:hypothetical protein
MALDDKQTDDQPTPLHDLLAEMFARIDARLHGDGVGIPAGFRDLDNLTGGLHHSELMILVGRPRVGKTTLALNIAENIAIGHNVPTLFVSLDLTRIELVQRILCSQGPIDADKFCVNVNKSTALRSVVGWMPGYDSSTGIRRTGQWQGPGLQIGGGVGRKRLSGSGPAGRLSWGSVPRKGFLRRHSMPGNGDCGRPVAKPGGR